VSFYDLIDVHDAEGPIVALFRRLLLRLRARRVQHWPIVDATIQTASVREVTDSESNVLGRRVRLVYTYTVRGVAYVGRAYGPVWSYEEQAALETAAGLIDKKLPIRYKPSNPGKSIYLSSDGGPPQVLLAEPDPKTGLVIVSLK
jgi:hypothetical protein